jgi:carbon monoxide dehydrogenase subunit G
MQISNEQRLAASQQCAWEALNSIEVLQKSIPGCESLVETAPQNFEVHILAAVGPVKAKFKGKLKLSDLQPPDSYRIDFEGQGGAAGHGKGSAVVKLTPSSANSCVLHYEATATVGGKIAQIGQRLVDMAAQKMAGEFFQNFNAHLEVLYPAPEPVHQTVVEKHSQDAPEEGKTSGMWSAIKAWFGRAFGKAS